MAVKVYIVAGASSCGKSSVIRHISPNIFPNKNSNWETEHITPLKTTNNVSISTFCKSRSLQEARIYPKEVYNYIQNFIQKEQPGVTYDAVLVALRTDIIRHKTKPHMPTAEAYINEFITNFKWQIEKVVDIVSSLQAYCQQNNHQYKSFQVINQSYNSTQAYPNVNQLYPSISTNQSYTIVNQLYDGLTPLYPYVKNFFGFI
jgi:hypothetical protein